MSLALLLGFSVFAFADFAPVIAHPRGILAQLDPHRSADFPRILDHVSAALVGKPYQLGPLGEGDGSPHPLPLYRTDAFDCTTYLETVMANAFCFRASAGCLEEKMRQIRYRDGMVGFATRNHIPELDWLPNNARRGFLEDLSTKIFTGEWIKLPSSIDREAWLAKETGAKLPEKISKDPRTLAVLPVSSLVAPASLTPEARKALEAKREAAAKEIAAMKAVTDEEKKDVEKKKFRADLDYLREAFVAREDRLKEIPSGTVLSLVRYPAKGEKARFTPLVYHQGLVIQTPDGPRIRQAAPNSHHVADQPLGDYLLRYIRSGKCRGVSLYRILAPKP